MVQKLIDWSLDNPLLIGFVTLCLIALGAWSFVHVNVEAYPDPAPAIIEVVAQYPGASAEEVERLVTVPIEVALAGMPGLTSTRSKSLFGLAHLRNQFEFGVDYDRARQEVINRLSQANVPDGVRPIISPASPIGEIYRYVLRNPCDSKGRPIYTLADLKALQDTTLQREFLRVPRVSGVVSSGGLIKRYEIHPDPIRLRDHGITLAQLQKAIAESNANVGGDVLVQGQTLQVVRGLGMIGAGRDPMQVAVTMKNPSAAAAFLRTEERRRLIELRQIVVAAINNKPVCVDHLVDGGPLRDDQEPGARGVVIAHQTRQGRIGMTWPVRTADGKGKRDTDGAPVWNDEDDLVQAIIVLRKGKESLPALEDVKARVKELNETPGRLLPGVKLEPYYDRTDLIGLTTETVHENLLLGMALVTLILLMFLSNVRTALIVAINIPLALFFAFAVLFLRGRSANLLSLGAVDFGIIIDSTVIMVENIYRHVSSGVDAHLPLIERVRRASGEVQKSLFFSTVIMVCALLPLFTMKGPEGQIFGPMADTYAFALAGALLLALTLSPVLCVLLFKNLRTARDNVLVRGLKRIYLWQLDVALKYRVLSLGLFAALVLGTAALLPGLGREFMPELEEGNVYLRGTFRINTSLENVNEKVRSLRAILRGYPEIALVVTQIGRPDDGTDPGGLYNVESFAPLRPRHDWPTPPGRDGPRTKEELIKELDLELTRRLPGVEWDFSQYIRDNVLESLSGVKGENSIKIFGPELDVLERHAREAVVRLGTVRGVKDAGVFRIKGQSNLEFAVDREKCQAWGIRVADVLGVLEAAVGGKACTQMREGEKTFDVTLRFPLELRGDEEAIRNIPVDVLNNTVTSGSTPTVSGSPYVGGTIPGIESGGTTAPRPALGGTAFHVNARPLAQFPQRRLGDLLTPLNVRGQPDASAGRYVRPGASTIAREQGQRFIAVKFGVRGRDLASTVAEAQEKINPLIHAPYRAEWSGEFQEMEEAEHRLLIVVSVSLLLILFLLYLAFRSFLDALVVYANVLAMSLGGVWALMLTGMNFNISAAVGFISILGVAVMNGLLFISCLNGLRAHGVELHAALAAGTEKLIRPVTMTALAAILGLLPAAVSTRIGAQSQRPLALVVVGGMIATLLLANLVPLLYSLYGQRTPPEGAGAMEH